MARSRPCGIGSTHRLSTRQLEWQRPQFVDFRMKAEIPESHFQFRDVFDHVQREKVQKKWN